MGCVCSKGVVERAVRWLGVWGVYMHMPINNAHHDSKMQW